MSKSAMSSIDNDFTETTAFEGAVRNANQAIAFIGDAKDEALFDLKVG